ncbi:hypothetical protein Trydic_g7737 [Trypoxylus dichotomus]
MCSVPGSTDGELQRMPQVAVREEGGNSATNATQAIGCKRLGLPYGKDLPIDGDRHPATIYQVAAVKKNAVKKGRRAGRVHPQTPSGCNADRRNPSPSQQPTLASELPSVSDREGVREGGTIILIKFSIYPHADLALDLNNIEATAITVNMATLGAVILAGDINAKHPSWNSRLTNASGAYLRRFADDFHLLVNATIESVIFSHNGQPDILDIVGMKDVAQFHQLTVLNELSSDHNPVLLQLGQTT